MGKQNVEIYSSYDRCCLGAGGHVFIAVRFRGGNGGAVAAGVVGGVAVGAIIGSQANGGYYGGPGYYQPDYQPVYNRCHTEREQVQDGSGRVYLRRVRVCD